MEHFRDEKAPGNARVLRTRRGSEECNDFYMGHEKVTSACHFFFFPTVIRPFCTFAVKRYSFSASGINLYETIINDSMLCAAEPDRCISKQKFMTANKCNRGIQMTNEMNVQKRGLQVENTRLLIRSLALIYIIYRILFLTLRE